MPNTPISSPSPRPRGRGRPAKDPAEQARTVGISLNPTMRQLAATIGLGSISLGVKIALREYAVRNGLQPEQSES